MKSTPSERSQKTQIKLAQQRAGKLNKIKANLRLLSTQKQEALPQNYLNHVLKLFNFTNGEALTLIACKHCLDFMLAGLIDEDASVTDLGDYFLCLSESKQVQLLRKEIVKLPKMEALRDVLMKKYHISSKELVETMPKCFFGEVAFKTQVFHAIKVLSWLR
ncbi:MAG TPA: hypothetical protein DCS93_10450 [Microscillaceae bacterium]|nr:hypothetical protein [Microscillaceae bacterium]